MRVNPLNTNCRYYKIELLSTKRIYRDFFFGQKFQQNSGETYILCRFGKWESNWAILLNIETGQPFAKPKEIFSGDLFIDEAVLEEILGDSFDSFQLLPSSSF